MKVVVSDTGVIISLIHINQLSIIESIFGDYYIPEGVWKELIRYDNPSFDSTQLKKIAPKVLAIHSKNHLSMVMDYGESESVILYEELKADFLLIDDNKARLVAESLDVNCIGTLGLLMKAKQRGDIQELKPLFETLLHAGRYFSIRLLNEILIKFGESKLGINLH